MNHYATNQTVTRPTVKFTVEKVPVNNNTSDTKKDDQTNNTGKNDQQIKNIMISAIFRQDRFRQKDQTDN